MFNEDEELKGEEVVEGEQDMDTHWTKYLRKNFPILCTFEKFSQ